MRRLIAAVTILAACRSKDAGSTAALQADLQHYLDTRGVAEHISAASLSVSLHGATSNINVAAGTTPANLFQIGSITKGETAVILLQLEAEGRLTMDQTVGHWLPQYPAWRAVTIRQLLNMTSGIPTYDDTRAWERAITADPHTVFTPDQLIAYVYPSTPAAIWRYSNTGYALCEQIIDSATHSDYATQLTTRIIQPLGLHNTFYNADLSPAAVTDRLVPGYYFNHDSTSPGLFPFLGRDVRTFSISWTRAAGGIIANPEDVTVLARSIFAGPLLPAAQRREILTIVSEQTGQPIATTTLANPKGFGLGTAQLTLPTLGTLWYYEGETLGYRMLYVYFPTQDAVIAVGLNSQPDKPEDQIGPLVQTIYTTLHTYGKL